MLLKRVSKGDLDARVSGVSQVELLEVLKEVTNETIESIDREITERKRYEKDIERLRRHHEVILNSAGEGILGTSPSAKVRMWR